MVCCARRTGAYGAEFFAQAFKGAPGLQNLTATEAWRVAYTWLLQNTISVANIWRDPQHLTQYYAEDKFLPVYNGVKATPAQVTRACVCRRRRPA